MLKLVPTFQTPLGGSDYKDTRFTVTFPAGVNVVRFSVIIFDDKVAESPEDFFLDLEIPPASLGVVKGSPGIARVSITDEDSECFSNALCFIEQIQDILNLHKF